jgi:hypothetical protein
MEKNQTPGLWQVAKSVLAAMLGVQKSENYQRDFQYGKPRQYIILGLIFVTLFVLILVGVVNLVLSLAGV